MGDRTQGSPILPESLKQLLSKAAEEYALGLSELLPQKFLHMIRVHRDYSVQFSSVTQSYPTLCDPMNHSMPGLPVHHQLPEFTQTHVH